MAITLAGAFLVGCSGETNTTQTEQKQVTIEWKNTLEDKEYQEILEKRKADTNTEMTERPLLDKQYVRLSPEEAVNFKTEGRTGIVYIGWEHCPFCHYLRYELDYVLEDLDQQIYFIERSDLEKHFNMGQEKEDAEGFAKFFEDFDIEYVPNILVIQDGEEITRMPEDILLSFEGEAHDDVAIMEWLVKNIEKLNE